MVKLSYPHSYTEDFFDLGYALEHNDVVATSNIEKALACVAGKKDEEPWYWVAQLENKNYVLLRGGCDYTGWDCQSYITVMGEYPTVTELLQNTPLQCVDSARNLRNLLNTQLFDLQLGEMLL